MFYKFSVHEPLNSFQYPLSKSSRFSNEEDWRFRPDRKSRKFQRVFRLYDGCRVQIKVVFATQWWLGLLEMHPSTPEAQWKYFLVCHSVNPF